TQMASGALNAAPLITRRFNFDHALDAYAAVSDSTTLGLVLEYASPIADLKASSSQTISHAAVIPDPAAAPIVGVLGAGDFVTGFMLPALATQNPPRFHTIVSAKGVTAAQAARKFGFAASSTDPSAVLDQSEINVVFVASYDAAHAGQTIAALAAGK